MADRKRRSLLHFRTRSSTPDSIPNPKGPPNPVLARVHTESHLSEKLERTEDGQVKSRSRVLTKPYRSSTFGSRRSMSSLREEKTRLTSSPSQASSICGDEVSIGSGIFGEKVVKAAEIQVASVSLFRRKTQYVVLSESHLIRFKNQLKATETFPSIPTGGRSTLPRSMSSLGSYTELQHNAALDTAQGIPLEELIAVYRLEDSKPCFSLEIAHLDERSKRGSMLQLHFPTPTEADDWLKHTRAQAMTVRAEKKLTYCQSSLSHITQLLERNEDYHPAQFHVFKVAQLSSVSTSANVVNDRSLRSNRVAYLVIGVNKVHILQAQRQSYGASTTSTGDTDVPASFGIMSLTSIKLDADSDRLRIRFRVPTQEPYMLDLASYEASEIAVRLRYCSEYLRPQWTVLPFDFDVPSSVEELLDSLPNVVCENDCFERTLVAYCAAFQIDSSRLNYSVSHECDDAPCFRLLPPVSGHAYNFMQLLAVLRSLQYNETFVSICFAGVDLTPLRDVRDSLYSDLEGYQTRGGYFVELPGNSQLSVLQQEVRALALRSRRLRKLDFSNAFPTHSTRKWTESGILEALAPICKKSLTNIDWIVLNGVRLSDRDVNYLVDAASERQCHLRALEVGDCGLTVNDVDVALSTLRVHADTVEVIDVSGAQGRFSPELFSATMSAFTRIRRLNLTRVQKTAGSESLIGPEILLGWRLESLKLDGTPLNEQSVDSISTYLASTKSRLLKELSFSNCGITGHDLAVFLHSMSSGSSTPRDILVNASNNRLGMGFSCITTCIAQNHSPTSLVMRMVDLERETHFRDLVEALSHNTTIKCLDISRASLPYDATFETCEALRNMFADNNTLEELDISGEAAHLESARFGIGLNIALTGLECNHTLRVLHIEYQNLGLQGASTLARVIEHNTSLREIHCEHNDTTLQSLTVLVNALEKNSTLLYLPTQDADRAVSMNKVKYQVEGFENVETPHSPKSGTIRKGAHAMVAKTIKRHHSRQSSMLSDHGISNPTAQDVDATIMKLNEKWTAQTRRLEEYLRRNHDLAQRRRYSDTERSFAVTQDASTYRARPDSTSSLGKALDRVYIDAAHSLVDFGPDHRI